MRKLIDLGADVNYEDAAGFPALIAVLSTGRPECRELVELLLAAGVDVNQRGINDFTPLHYAAARNDPTMIELLVAHGADLDARTRIDDLATPLEEARRAGHREAIEILEKISS